MSGNTPRGVGEESRLRSARDIKEKRIKQKKRVNAGRARRGLPQRRRTKGPKFPWEIQNKEGKREKGWTNRDTGK